MNRIFLLICIALHTLSSCSNDDNSSMNPDANILDFNGQWHLINVSGGFVGLDHNFDRGVVVWSFNDTGNTVTIVNNNNDSTIQDLLPTGTYRYSIISVRGNQEFILDDINRGNFERTANGFNITESFKDGLKFIFQR
ncbi:hypothetical protein J8281_15265 [Aquimarina sp. U1-2]|uniref:hypothetical protein n=1 Tax=Aquimarina sp. U1-2 TaxID=2823141 RepID=UPI001AED0553|nr:hypothetical protein [Aquimarina sp. U1-2]MBP2833554.1 hypothetical protein [Aquimarina sp. U1-2]